MHSTVSTTTRKESDTYSQCASERQRMPTDFRHNIRTKHAQHRDKMCNSTADGEINTIQTCQKTLGPVIRLGESFPVRPSQGAWGAPRRLYEKRLPLTDNTARVSHPVSILFLSQLLFHSFKYASTIILK